MIAKLHLLFVSLKGSVFGVHHDPCQYHLSSEVSEWKGIRSERSMLNAARAHIIVGSYGKCVLQENAHNDLDREGEFQKHRGK